MDSNRARGSGVWVKTKLNPNHLSISIGYFPPPEICFSSSPSGGRIAVIAFRKGSRLLSTICHISARLTPSYWWIKTSRNPASSLQGIAGWSFRYSSGIRFAALPIICTVLAKASMSLRSFSIEAHVSFSTDTWAYLAVESMWLRRILSSFRILLYGWFNDFLSKIGTKILRRPHIHLSTHNLPYFDLHACKSNESWNMFRIVNTLLWSGQE